MIFRERCNLGVSNPVLEDFSAPVTEALLSDLKISEVRAVYPLIRAINSGRLTKNYTFYPAEALIGKNNPADPTGYASFAKPYGKPIIREHQAQNVPGLAAPIETADVPMGRIVYSGFRRYKEKTDGSRTMPSKKYVPGTVEGDGAMFVVPAITDPEAITRVLGGAYHTVSIGSRVENVTESISNQNIAELRRQGKELPPYERGQLYEGRLSYWRMGEVRGMEVSFVNVPSDEYAKVVDPDIGAEGIRLLVAEKKSNSKEFAFYDAKTAEKVDIGLDEGVWDESFFESLVDSSKVGQNIWWLKHPTEEATPVGAAINESKEEAPKETSQEGEETMTIEDILEKNLDEIITLYPETNTEETLKEALLEKFVTDIDVTTLVSGEGADQIENIELFQKVSEFATEVVGDWNEAACKFALSLYLANEGTLKENTIPIDENAKVTVGELYGVEGENAALETTLTHKEWNELPDECFVGEGRTIPVTNINSALYAIQLFPEKRSDIGYRSVEFGILPTEQDVLISPVFIGAESTNYHLISIKSTEDVAPLLENVDTICETYSLNEESKSQVIKFLEQITEETFKQVEGAPLFAYTEQSIKPVVLGTAFLLDYFTKNEAASESRTNLVMLVGLTRKLGITKETLNQVFEAYNVFGTSVLRKFLEATPEKIEESSIPKEEIKEEHIVTPTSVDTIPDPVAATEQTNDGQVTKESSKPLYFTTKRRSSGKNPVNIKEKK
jgi:hypothetical protein